MEENMPKFHKQVPHDFVSPQASDKRIFSQHHKPMKRIYWKVESMFVCDEKETGSSLACCQLISTSILHYLPTCKTNIVHCYLDKHRDLFHCSSMHRKHFMDYKSR